MNRSKRTFSKKALAIGIFVAVYTVSIIGIYCGYLTNCEREMDKTIAICEEYSKKNELLDDCSFIGYNHSQIFFYSFRVPSYGYLTFDVFDLYKVQFYLNSYEYAYGTKVPLSSVACYFSEGITPESVQTSTISPDKELASFLEYLADYACEHDFTAEYDETSFQVELYEKYQSSNYYVDFYHYLLDAKCQEMYGVGLFDVEAEGEGDSSQIGNYDLWDYVLTMDQMNAAAQSLLLEKDAVS